MLEAIDKAGYNAGTDIRWRSIAPRRSIYKEGMYASSPKARS